MAGKVKRIGVAVLLCGLGALSAAAQEVGQVVRVAPEVDGRRNGQTSRLVVLSPVFQGMQVETYRRAGARIAINTDLPQRKGMMVLGPETRVELVEYVVNLARGLKMSVLVKLGQYRLAFLPPPEGAALEKGQYLIETPNKTQIRMTGTDVAVQVEADGTTIIRVLEGEATVKGQEGVWVRIPAGYQVRVPRQGQPQPLIQFDYCRSNMIHAGRTRAQVDYTHGVLAFESGENEEAAALFANAAHEDPNEGTPLHWLGLAELRLGRPTDAVTHLEASLKARRRPAAGRARVKEDLRVARQALAGGAVTVEAPPYQPETLRFGWLGWFF